MIVPITSFKGGYWSEKMSGRFELEGYQSACSKLENWLPIMQGGVTVRPGTLHCGSAKSSVNDAILIPFIISTTVAYVVELGNFYARFWKNGAAVKSGSNKLEIVTPWPAAVIRSIRYAQLDNSLIVVSREYAPFAITWAGGDNFTSGNYAFEGKQWISNEEVEEGDIRFNENNLYYCLTTGTTGLTGPTGTTEFTNASDESDVIKDGTAEWRWLQNSPFRSANNYPGCVAVFGGRLWFASTYNKPQGLWGSAAYDYDDFMTFEVANYKNRQMTDAATYYFTGTATASRIITTSKDPRLFCSVGQYLTGPTKDEVDTVVPGTKILELTATTVVVDQDLVLGKGSLCYTASNWITATTPEYEVATIIKDVIGEGDAIAVDISTGESDRIIDITSAKYLFIRTVTDEITIPAGASPTTIAANIQSRRGSSDLKAVYYDNRPLYIQGDRIHVREFTYDSDSETYESPDVTFFASDVTAPGIIQWDYAQTPDPTLYCVLEGGAVAVLVYDKYYQVQAWARFVMGTVLSVAAIPGESSDDVYFLVERNGTREVEILSKPDNKHLLDDGVIITKGSSVTIDGGVVSCGASGISGLIWLAGKAVRVVCGGKNYNVVAGSDGFVALTGEETGETVHVGLAYEAVGRTMRLSTSTGAGLSQGQIQRYVSAVMRVIGSYPFTVGSGDEETVSMTGPFTGNAEVSLPDGWDRDGWIQFQQKNSLPVTITAIMANTGDATQ